MNILIVVDDPVNWPLKIPGVQLISPRRYLTDQTYGELPKARVFNLSRSYRYQSVGYYVSLLAEARGHKVQPSVAAIQDMKSRVVVSVLSEEIEDLIQRLLAPLRSSTFVLSIYFGRTLAKRTQRLGSKLFDLFGQAPLLRASFSREDGQWRLVSVGAIDASGIPPSHQPFVVGAATEYLAKGWRVARRTVPRYELAILHDPSEGECPSDERAIRRFVRAAEELKLGAEVITKEDYSRLGEFDALFIRQTTSVNHYTYRFAQRAEAEGLIVIDDPESILKCTNKVYLTELLAHHDIPSPKTLVVHRKNVDQVHQELGFPAVLKEPDGSFSQGVVKVQSRAELEIAIEKLLQRSELVLAQDFMPTEFDWRVGIFDGQPLFVCRYFMASNHWQIVKRQRSGRPVYGKVDTLRIEDAPPQVVRTALRAAKLVGNGLYGVDLKQVGRRCVVIEINDNPNIDAGAEDHVLKEELYLRVMRVFLERIERRSRGGLRT